MERMRYFCDTPAGPIALQGVWPMANREFAQQFPGVAGLRADGYSRWAGYPIEGPGGPLPVTRRIDFKAQPSLHLCNAKCLNGKATGSCECRCGGRNHGRGSVTGLITGLCALASGADADALGTPLAYPLLPLSGRAPAKATTIQQNDNLIGVNQ